jgi:hypothetical protein
LKRQKSMSSAAESISAWNAVFDCPSMVAALTVARQLLASSSAAFRNTAARSSQGQRDHSRCAAAAASIASVTCSAPAFCQSASTWAWACGMTAFPVSPLFTSRPPMIRGMCARTWAIVVRRALSSARSAEPGA